MARVFCFFAVGLAAGINTDGPPGVDSGGSPSALAAARPLENARGQGDLLRREGSSDNITAGHKKGPFMMWEDSGDESGMHHSPSELLPVDKEMKDRIAETGHAVKGAGLLKTLTPVASQKSHEPDRSNNSSPIPGTSQKAATIASIATTTQAPSLSDRRLTSQRRPGGLDVREIAGHTTVADHSTVQDCDPQSGCLKCPETPSTAYQTCLAGGDYTATPAPTISTTEGPTVDGAYKEAGATGETTDEMNTNGIWHWGKTVYAEAGNGGWTWLQSPDGDWNLVWVTVNTGNRWLWLMPNRFQWSGHHRRRGTWMHVSGADWRSGVSAHEHLLRAAEADERGGGHHDLNSHVGTDSHWNFHDEKAPTPSPNQDGSSIVENKYAGRSALSQSGSNSRNQSPRAMPTATLTATDSGTPTPSPAEAASIDQHFEEVVKYSPLEALKEIKNTEIHQTPLIYGSMVEKD